MPQAMNPRLRTPTAWLLIGWVFVSSSPDVSAEPLQKSNLGSTLNQQCDFCWYPSPNEQDSDRLPTYRHHRPRRPPDSRPQRYPKGRYKLGPAHKQSRLSTLRARSRHEMKVLSTLQVRAVDGDTIRVGSERIRLRGIDTPELSEFDGPRAKRRLEELLRSGSIRIEPRGRDVYHRLVADIYVNEQNVAEILRSESFLKAS